MSTPRVEMNDAAWVWYDYEMENFVIDCPRCGLYIETGPANSPWAVALANLHNNLHHKQEVQLC